MSNKALFTFILCAAVAACASPPAEQSIPVASSAMRTAPVAAAGPILFVTLARFEAERATLKGDFYNGTMIVLLGPNVDASMLRRAFGVDEPAGRSTSRDLADGTWLRPDGTISSFALTGDSGIDIKAEAAQMAAELFRDAASAAMPGLARQTNASLDAPSPGAWLPITEETVSDVNGQIGSDEVTWDIYRLNGISRTDDWYMLYGRVKSKVQKTAQYEWKILSRGEKFTIEKPLGELYQHEPTTVNTVTRYSWTVGGGLTASLGPQPAGYGNLSASYSKSWETKAVRTIDMSRLTSADWQDEFDASHTNAQDDFVNYVAAIFDVPKTKEPLQFSAQIRDRYSYGGRAQDWRYQTRVFTASPPEFSVAGSKSPRAIEVSPGNDAYVVVRSGVYGPGGALVRRFAFTTSGSTVPAWLKLPLPGANESCTFKLHVNPDGVAGSVASLEFNSDPPFEASSLEQGPLWVLVRVRNGLPNPTPPPPPAPPLCTQ